MLLLVITFLLLLHYVYLRLSCGIAKTGRCLVGKVAIVTGGNTGIGYEVCLNLAARGCRVIIADKDDSTETREKIMKLTGNPNIVSKIVDLASFRSIRNFASEINKAEEKLHILVNNAGIGASTRGLSEDGLNFVMQVNYFGPFLLTHLLMDLLKKSAPSRIIFTSSVASYFGNLRNTNYSSARNVRSITTIKKNYADSKLATIMASDLFAKKLENTGVTSNSVHPGVVRTAIFNSLKETLPLAYICLRILVSLYAKNVWEGAQTTIHLATSNEVEKISGKYFQDCKEMFKPSQAKDKKLCEQVWKTSEECVKLAPNEKL